MHTNHWPRTLHLDNDVTGQVGEAHAAYDLDLVVHLAGPNYGKENSTIFYGQAEFDMNKGFF